MQAKNTDFVTLLTAAGMTQVALSRELGITTTAISRWHSIGIPQYAVAYLKLKAENISLKKQLGADGGI